MGQNEWTNTSNKHFWNDFFKNQIVKESDRAAVIISTSMIDQALESLLRARFIQLTTSEDPLFDGPYSPLANFSARIDIAYRIGLLFPNYAKALHLIRKIRNDFAHDVGNSTFDNPKIRHRMTEIDKSLGVLKVSRGRAQFSDGLRGDFEATVSWIIWMLWSLVDATTSFPSPGEWTPPLEQSADSKTKL